MLTRMVNHVHFIFAVRIPQHRRNCASASTQLVAVLRLLSCGEPPREELVHSRPTTHMQNFLAHSSSFTRDGSAGSVGVRGWKLAANLWASDSWRTATRKKLAANLTSGCAGLLAGLAGWRQSAKLQPARDREEH
uniref:Uncharacterized protein n=1 Tax=Zea mays TaxID=4577 RepID=C0P308_MAIZE|nr:unknown [Zea mays]|eukprot:NP_001182806.1 uncharacterized protein LOC100501023 [Zea mays]